MRILHILGERKLAPDPNLQPVSGVVRAVLEIARAQACLGHDVTIAVVASQNWQSCWQGVRLRGLKSWPFAKFQLRGKVIDLRAHLPFVMLTHQHTYDIVQGHLYYYLRFLRAGARVAHFHADPFYAGSKNEGVDLKASDMAVIRANSSLQVAISKFVAGEIEQAFCGYTNICFVPNGIDINTFGEKRDYLEVVELKKKWGIPADGIILLFAGAVVPEKGVLQLACAFQRLAVYEENLFLVIVGDNKLWGSNTDHKDAHKDYEQAVRAKLTHLATSGRVHFAGRIAAGAMPLIYHTSDIVVVPSICREGFGQVALEAIATGKPVIASRAGGLPEIIDEHVGMLVQPGDEHELERAIYKLATDADLRSRLGTQGTARAANFSWLRTARQLDSLYQSILTMAR